MNNEQFVKAINLYVIDQTKEATIQRLKKPPGRRLKADIQELTDWYNSLSPRELYFIERIIAMSVHGSIFDLFAVLDGVKKIDLDNGVFELTYVGDERIILNNPDEIGLHELLNSYDLPY